MNICNCGARDKSKKNKKNHKINIEIRRQFPSISHDEELEDRARAKHTKVDINVNEGRVYSNVEYLC